MPMLLASLDFFLKEGRKEKRKGWGEETRKSRKG